MKISNINYPPSHKGGRWEDLGYKLRPSDPRACKEGSLKSFLFGIS